jgi:excisionase family DNA binding protein
MGLETAQPTLAAEDVPPAASVSPWMTVAAAARYAGVSSDLIYSACARNELRHVRVGGRRSIRLRAAWIDAWLERHARGANAR